MKSAGLSAARRAPSGGDVKLTAADSPAMVEAVLSYQLPCGGWSKALGYSNVTSFVIAPAASGGGGAWRAASAAV